MKEVEAAALVDGTLAICAALPSESTLEGYVSSVANE